MSLFLPPSPLRDSISIELQMNLVVVVVYLSYDPRRRENLAACTLDQIEKQRSVLVQQSGIPIGS